jgi:phenylpropionate dioxygenase-like ring-hydroxylating dioxygenase large terminal subunit
MVGARLVGDALECPIHRRRFGPNGLCVNRPDGKPAQLLPVREEVGYLWLPPAADES